MRLNALGILCADLEASLRFYRLLGVDLPDHDTEQGHYEADLGGFRLMLDSHDVARAFIEDFRPPSGNDQVTFAVEVESPAEVDRVHDSMVAEGFDSVRAPFDAFWGQRYATLADPDGNAVDLYAAFPGP